jgi:hypothetical protein
MGRGIYGIFGQKVLKKVFFLIITENNADFLMNFTQIWIPKSNKNKILEQTTSKSAGQSSSQSEN